MSRVVPSARSRATLRSGAPPRVTLPRTRYVSVSTPQQAGAWETRSQPSATAPVRRATARAGKSRSGRTPASATARPTVTLAAERVTCLCRLRNKSPQANERGARRRPARGGRRRAPRRRSPPAPQPGRLREGCDCPRTTVPHPRAPRVTLSPNPSRVCADSVTNGCSALTSAGRPDERFEPGGRRSLGSAEHGSTRALSAPAEPLPEQRRCAVDVARADREHDVAGPRPEPRGTRRRPRPSASTPRAGRGPRARRRRACR